MNITDNLIRIKEGKDNIIKSLKNKGVSIDDNTLINEIPTIIDNAEIGGGGGSDTPVQPETPELVQKYEGATVFRINVPNDNYEFAINLCNDASTATYDVDWGDGSLESGLTIDEQHHTYSKAGTYDVNVYNLSKDITLGGSTSISGSNNTIVYYLFNNTHNDYWLGNTYKYQKDNTTVTNVLLGDKISSIGYNTFNGCSSLQSIVIPEGVISIGNNVFQNCSSLQSVVIPEGVISIGNNVFKNCSSLQSVVIPEGVTSIGQYAFQNCSSLQSIVIPEGVTKISTFAFQNCSSLQSVVIPEGVTKIDSSTFDKCSSLQSIVIPNSVTSIGSSAFNSCSSLQSIVIPEGVTKISTSAFQNCSSLQSVVIPEGVTEIDSSTFNGCSSLPSIVIPEGVTKINNAFNECYSLIYIDLPNTLTSISGSNFNGSYSTSNSLHYIISRAKTAPTIQDSFNYSASSGILYIPKDADITTYQSSYWKTNLLDKGWTIEYIEDMPEKVPSTLEFTTVNDMLFKVSKLGKGQLISEEKIDNKYIYNFDDTIYLRQNTLPKTLFTTMKFIGSVELAFSCCSGWTTLQSIDIPEGITSIGNNAFQNCYALQSITCKAMIAPTIQSGTFSSIGTSVPSGTPKVLQVPEGATGYDSGNWKSYVLDKGYTLEYVPLSEL